MPKARPPKKERSRANGRGEYRFKIDAYTPATIPLARLAEYLEEVAVVLGERSAVHFSHLEEGSTVPVLKIDKEARPKVLDRIESLGRGDAPRDALNAFRNINRKLRDDNATGVLQTRKRGGVILCFPGRELVEDRFPSVRQDGSLDGVVVRVGGTDETVPILLQSEGEAISGIHADRRVAKALAQHLFEPVRLHGKGRWSRDLDGVWALVDFKAESFDILKEVPLSVAIEDIRGVAVEWGSEAYNELRLIRGGPEGRKHGRA